MWLFFINISMYALFNVCAMSLYSGCAYTADLVAIRLSITIYLWSNSHTSNIPCNSYAWRYNRLMLIIRIKCKICGCFGIIIISRVALLYCERLDGILEVTRIFLIYDSDWLFYGFSHIGFACRNSNFVVIPWGMPEVIDTGEMANQVAVHMACV